jgi:hypothetical protein
MPKSTERESTAVETVFASEYGAASYLECLDKLRQEIAVSIGAIASNSLEHLRESVSNQEALCSRLHILIMAAQSRQSFCPGPVSLKAPPTPIDREISEAWRKLNTSIVDYAALRRHSGKSIAILASLCRSYRGAFPFTAAGESCRRNCLGEA